MSCHVEVELTKATKDTVAKLPNFKLLVRRKAAQKQQLIPEHLLLDNLNQ